LLCPYNVGYIKVIRRIETKNKGYIFLEDIFLFINLYSNEVKKIVKSVIKIINL